VVVLNLVKSAEKRPRETILRKEFAISIAYINQQVCALYMHDQRGLCKPGLYMSFLSMSANAKRDFPPSTIAGACRGLTCSIHKAPSVTACMVVTPICMISWS